MKRVIGIDIGGTNLRIGLVDKEGNLEYFEKKSSASLISENAVENLKNEILDYISRYQLNKEDLVITVGVPSAVSKDKSFIYSSPNLKGLENMDLGHLLKDALGIPAFVDRDVNYLLMNDIKNFDLDPDKDKTILGMYLGTGFGNALYVNGKLFSGKHGVAGELGHIPLMGTKGLCGCGNTECCELKCSGKHLQELREEYFPDTCIDDIFTEHGDDPIIQEYIDTLAYPISTEITLFDPDYVVMAGGVMIMKDFPMERLIEQIKQKTRHPYPAEDINFIYPKHTQTSGVIGGALAYFASEK